MYYISVKRILPPKSFADFAERVEKFYAEIEATDDGFIPHYADLYLAIGLHNYDVYEMKHRDDGRIMGRFSWCEGRFSEVLDIINEAKD